jgi:serine acetyltransferase
MSAADTAGSPGSPRASLRSLLRADFIARYPNATAWGAWRTLARFVTDPSLQAVLIVRLVQRSPGRLLFLWRTFTIARFRMEIFRSAIGPGLHLPHPFSIILAHGVRIGRDVTINHNVTIGFARAPQPGELLPSPAIGDRVVIGAGCIVVGPIQVGADSVLEPGAYVSRHVPPRSIVKRASGS